MDLQVTVLIESHLPLAELIALEYSNIPGSTFADARSEANVALLKAAETFDPAKGDFHTYANRVIRNRLNTFYAKQLRLAKLFPKSLDEPIRWNDAQDIANDSSQPHLPCDPKQDVINEVRKVETESALAAVMKLLSPRERVVIDGLRAGKSYQEIAVAIGVSKQAVHKTAHSALSKLRQGLHRLGYRSLASDGHLASSDRKK